MSGSWGWRPYVPVARRRAQARAAMQKMQKKGANIQPVVIDGRQIARTFWGRSWCEHMEKFSDYENRLPRGRTYVRNGSVCHLEIHKGRVAAKVSGSQLYSVAVTIKALPKASWKRVRESCAGQVGSLLELLQGKLSDHVMNVVTDRENGLFPKPTEIRMECSCPDWAGLCKHVAAVMYGIGSRLDAKPELLFVLRGVDHNELISRAAAKQVLKKAPKAGQRTLDDGQLAEVFGIDLAPQHGTDATAVTPRTKKPGSKPSRRTRRKIAPLPAAAVAPRSETNAKRVRSV